jgi:uncharacterized protein HemY
MYPKASVSSPSTIEHCFLSPLVSCIENKLWICRLEPSLRVDHSSRLWSCNSHSRATSVTKQKLDNNVDSRSFFSRRSQTRERSW